MTRTEGWIPNRRQNTTAPPINPLPRMRHAISLTLFIAITAKVTAQTDPVIVDWLFNTTNLTGSHYVSGNPVPIQDNVQANVQQVQYSDNWSYVHTQGVPAYITGPFLDGNPNLASGQSAIFKIPRVPQPNTGTLTGTTGGDIGVFINGVALFDFRDGAGWNPNTNALCGGPGNPPCPGPPGQLQDWNRDAVVAERAGFDCAKGHPQQQGTYHHHQNPSAFNLDLNLLSTVCDLYLADGLYAIDSTAHSPLLGFAFDGYPIYGAYGFANADGSGGITRIRSGYQLRNITTRTTHADGADVSDGPVVSQTYPLGYFREDYEFVQHAEPYYLDAHNGRFCVTPEYPGGTYAYFCTVDEHWNSAYPYVVGPTFYGVKNVTLVTNITEDVTTYDPTTAVVTPNANEDDQVTVFPNPGGELIAVQMHGLVRENLPIALCDMSGRLVRSDVIKQGSTIWYLDTRTLYDGLYTVRIGEGQAAAMVKVQVAH